MNITGNSEIICFGGEDWWYHNRGHIDMQLMRRYAKNRKVLYVNSLVMQKPRLAPGSGFSRKLARKAKSIFRGIRKVDAGFWVYSPLSLPVHHMGLLSDLNYAALKCQLKLASAYIGLRNPVIWVACPIACNIAMELRTNYLVYQRTDRYEEFPNIDAQMVTRLDRRLKASADITIYANQALCTEEQDQCRYPFFLDHGVDYELFASAANTLAVPPEMKNIKKPVIGFYGGIDDHTFDMHFAQQLVRLLPEMNFVFVGKSSIDCSGLSSRSNVTLIGQQPYEKIPDYGTCFDVAIMPWRQNRWIQVCNPIKLKEYLALGKPVVSTPFSELSKYADCVYSADTPSAFAQAIKRALAENSPLLESKRRQRVQPFSWESKAALVFEKLYTSQHSRSNDPVQT